MKFRNRNTNRVATEAVTDREGVRRGPRLIIAADQKRIGQAQSRLVQRKADLLAAGSAPQQVAIVEGTRGSGRF